jgi:hypothetical protein
MIYYILFSFLIIFSILGFILIKDLLYIIDYIKYKKTIKIYNKKYKKYLDDKKELRDKRLENENQIRKQYGIELVQNEEEQEYIVGFVKPVGKHSQQEFMKNKDRYMKISQMMERLSSKGVKNAYWRIVTNTAHKIININNEQNIKNVYQQKEFDLSKERNNNSKSRGR